jgi:hypothetical protein
MRRIWSSTVAISLALGATSGFAQDNPWQSRNQAQARGDAPAATLGRPVPAATLGRPVPLVTGGAAADPASVQPAAFERTSTWNPQPTLSPSGSAPQLSPISPDAPILFGDAGSNDKPKTTLDPTPAPLPAPRGVPQAGSSTAPAPCATCGGGMAGAPAAGAIGTGFPYGWGLGPANSLFGPILPYAGGPNRFYASAEFLLWFAKDAHVPALAITTAVVPTNTTPRPQPETVLFGDGVNGLFPSNRYGGRFTIGTWFSPCQCRGLEVSFLFLGTTETNFVVSSNQVPIISRPFFNLNRNEPFSEIVAAPGIAAGSLQITTESSLWGGEINYRRALLRACDGCGSLDALAGFRYLHLNENVSITERFTSTATTNGVPAAAGTVFDRFSTINDFYGAQLGLVFSRQWGRWSLDATAKVALGDTHNQVNISGGQSLQLNGVPTSANAGLLALGTNSGNHSADSFSVVPEFGINLGYQITPRMKFFVGYSFLYWSNVVRPGDQIDTGIDVTRIPNFNPIDRNGNPITTPVANRPIAPLARTDFWAQGINFGLQFKW